MKEYDFLLSEIPAPDEIVMDEPRFVNITEDGKVYRVIIRTFDLYCSYVEYQNMYKRYPSHEWFCFEALFELIAVQPSIFE